MSYLDQGLDKKDVLDFIQELQELIDEVKTYLDCRNECYSPLSSENVYATYNRAYDELVDFSYHVTKESDL